MRWPALFVLLLSTSSAAGDPLRLRGNALASAQAPAGLLVLDADSEPTSTLSAEALVWLAPQNARDEIDGDVLVVALRARDPKGRASARVGRFVAALGALRPLHVDGVSGRVQLPKRVDLEVMGGIPVLPTAVDGSRTWDWVAGGRVARRIGESGSVGISYLQQRDAGRLARDELGADAGLAIDARHDVGARVAYNLVGEGIAEAGVTASARRGPVRAEVFAQHRKASQLLPATSLFTVLGDVPAQRVGTVITWRAAPRLDVIGDVGVRRAQDELGEDVSLRTRLRLDPRGASSVGCELHRTGGASEASWTGVRGSALIALPRAMALVGEVEVARADVAHRDSAVWPWMLVAITRRTPAWELAVALEASATPEYRHRIDTIFQLSRVWSPR